MPEYQLELKQIVEFPRCRMYRQFVQTLMDDRAIRVSGGSGLFYFTVLCAYANFRTSYRRISGISYTVYPGEWVCSLKEMQGWFRARFLKQALTVLEDLQARRLITYHILGHGKVVRFKILDWQKHNTVLDYNAPCYKDTGFFFMPIATASELIGAGRCSEMDIVLDLWLNTIYNDEQVQGSDVGAVVYMRNGTGNPLLCYSDLAHRWGISKATVGRILKRLSNKDYLSLFSYPGRQGSVIYLRNYLSTMFQICDVLLDKEEVAMTLNIPFTAEELAVPLTKAACSVSDSQISVSKPEMYPLLEKVRQILSHQGISCFSCPKAIYKLSPLSGCKDESCKPPTMIAPFSGIPRWRIVLSCRGQTEVFIFEMSHICSAMPSAEVYCHE